MSAETLAQEPAYVEAVRALLDSLEALGSHRKAAMGGGGHLRVKVAISRSDAATSSFARSPRAMAMVSS